MNNNVLAAAVLGLFLAVGLVLGGSYLNSAAVSWKSADRSVTVKGLAEREVKADLALWPLHFTVTGNDLTGVQKKIDDQAAVIRAFLRDAGFAADEITLTSPQVTDQYANSYGNQRPDARYSAEATMLVRTDKIAAVKQSMPRVGALISRGVLLSPNYNYRTEFLFTGLESIKPDMIAKATADARAAAKQFAEDSGSEVGQIRSASQGYFSIQDLDSYTPDIKRVRVVTTIDYALDD
ncbi:SIMPL domain-containing protein [Salinisphaera aquimarina]|uniref:SIMPL domain-containing protein n=1 Tax=Salinisphaera aquimarina TaxID=2094031 RepID=A0ABV7EIM0_9GAMM